MNEADPLYSSYIANCVFNACSAYTAVVLNILTIHAIRQTSSLPKPLKTLLLSLAVSDLCVGLLVQPLYVACETMRLQQNTAFYSAIKAYVFTALTFVNASFFSVVAISVDRFLAIHFHLRYQELVTHKRAAAVMISIWCLSVFIPVMYFWISVVAARVAICVILGFCFICTTIVYFRIYLTVRRHRIQIQALQVQQLEENANFARQRKSAVSTFYVYLVFLICCLPEYCMYCMSLINPQISRPSIAFTGLLLYCKTLVRINSSLNPIIYCWKMRHIRHAIMNILRNILPSRQN